jgi:hypothetical protein
MRLPEFPDLQAPDGYGNAARAGKVLPRREKEHLPQRQTHQEGLLAVGVKGDIIKRRLSRQARQTGLSRQYGYQGYKGNKAIKAAKAKGLIRQDALYNPIALIAIFALLP